jgi:Domain of unknown function (DUF4437)
MTPNLAWHIDNIPWQDTSTDGTKYALLEGQRDLAGAVFSYAFFIPAGFWDPPHWHTQDARVTVLKGSLHLAYGDEFDSAKLEVFPAGSFVVVPAKSRHFDGSDEDTIIVGTALGPWATHYVDASVQPSAGTVS